MAISTAEDVVPYMLWENEFVEDDHEDDYDSCGCKDSEDKKLFLAGKKGICSDIWVKRESQFYFPHHDVFIVSQWDFKNG